MGPVSGDKQQHSSEFYLERAQVMRIQAENAQTDEMRRAYMALAADWARLADMVKSSRQAEKKH